MKRGLFLFMLLLWTANAQAGNFWDKLWHNADQQGERLMQKGDAAAAAQTYSDPRRKAYAELQAGDYANAANHFSAFDDSNANYNRGNALAQAGQLEEALKAYDAALAQDPNDKDARHNRDLVAKALQQQPPQNKSAPDKDVSSKDDKNGDQKQSGQSGDKNGSKQDDAQNNSDKQDSSGQNQDGKQQQGKSGQGKEGNKDQQQTGQPDSNQPNPSGQQNQAQANDAEQARRDAAAALGKAPAGNARAPSDAPVSEQQLAQEQWLRAIPDDPGGLLRRKFMIEHMIRQQGRQQ
ncbi:MAG: tetratricopeptide repeat protein [Gammaproteobacteria bacterium]|nr:tetratricopeptide repeat protein [Gammaproteobacteria bacterium]MBU1482744.1 tetratricopeptide repeat protein [Gammaproteobacteria bacterium]